MPIYLWLCPNSQVGRIVMQLTINCSYNITAAHLENYRDLPIRAYSDASPDKLD
jgi:hypothetical protein